MWGTVVSPWLVEKHLSDASPHAVCDQDLRMYVSILGTTRKYAPILGTSRMYAPMLGHLDLFVSL